MQQYNLNKVIGVVELPEHAFNPTLTFSKPYFQINYEFDKYSSYTHGGFCLFFKDFGGKKKYPKEGELTLLGTSKDMTEEMAKMIMPMYESYGYRLYDERPDILVKSALESFRSWERSVGMVSVNPYGTKRPSLNDYDISNASQDYMDGLQMEICLNQEAWDKAQQQVVNIAYLIKG